MTDTNASAPASPTANAVDVVVIGGGNAGFCAAHAAREAGANVMLLEKAPEAEAGGNTFYTAGACRVVHAGGESLRSLLDDETLAKLGRTDLAPYTAEEFRADMERLTEGRNDKAMTEVLIADSADWTRWMADKGIAWRLMYERQAYEADDRFVFWGGLALGVVDGGKGLVAQHTKAAVDAGVDVRYGAACRSITRSSDGTVTGVDYVDAEGRAHLVTASAVVLTAGGFEADPDRRAAHMGAEWRNAVVRGTPTNTGEMLEAALDAGAIKHGDWATGHAVAIDANADPAGGNRVLTNQLTRQSYPVGIVVNTEGNRFLDEGADFRNYTYAKYGAEILAQPGGLAFQLFDATTSPLLREEEYGSRPIAMAEADSLDELALALGIDPAGLERTISEFNDNIVDAPFDPTVKDGRASHVEPPRSNWANPLTTPPFVGYAVRCGVTFTFGGIRIDDHARVVDDRDQPIAGLYAAGEMAGGLFSGNYPGGSGLTAGGVFGRRAGWHAAGGRPEGLAE